MGLYSFGTTPAWRLGLAAAALSVCLPATAYAETFTVTGIASTVPATVPGVTTNFSVPTVELTDANINEKTVRALFAGDIASTATALAGLDAARIFIPEISLTYEIPGETGAVKSTVTYRDFEISNVVDGVASATTIGGASSTMTGSTTAGSPANFSVEFGAMSTGRFDVAGLLGFYGYVPAEATAEMKPIYNDLKFAGMNFLADKFSCDVAPMAIAEFRARPLKHPLADLTAMILEADAAEKAGTPPSPETVKTMIDYYVDLFTAFESTPTTAGGFTCNGPDDKGQPMIIASGPITMGGFKPGIYPELVVNDFKLEVTGDGSMSFGNFTFKPMDFANAIATLQNATGPLDEAWFTANARKLIPAFDGLSLADFAMDIPDPENDGERLKGTLGAFDVTLADYVNGIPADIALSAANLIFAIPEGMTEGPGPELLANGITEVDLSLGSKFHWDKATKTIVVEDLMVDAGKLGRVAVTGTIGNATEALFADDPMAATAAAQLLTLKTVTIDIDDRGIGPMLVAAGAREAGQPVPAFRMAMGGMLQGMTLAILGNSDDALKAAQALGAFIGGAPALTLTLTAKDPVGLGLADLAGIEANPTILAGKIIVTAEASGEPLPEPVPATVGGKAATPTQQEKLGLKTPPATQ